MRYEITHGTTFNRMRPIIKKLVKLVSITPIYDSAMNWNVLVDYNSIHLVNTYDDTMTIMDVCVVDVNKGKRDTIHFQVIDLNSFSPATTYELVKKRDLIKVFKWILEGKDDILNDTVESICKEQFYSPKYLKKVGGKYENQDHRTV